MKKKIYFDESFPKYIVETLDKLTTKWNQDHPESPFEVFSTSQNLGKRVLDTRMVIQLDEEAAWLVVRELSPQRTRLETRLLAQYGVPLVFLQLPRTSSQMWQVNKVLSSNWFKLLENLTPPSTTVALRLDAEGNIAPIDIFE